MSKLADGLNTLLERSMYLFYAYAPLVWEQYQDGLITAEEGLHKLVDEIATLIETEKKRSIAVEPRGTFVVHESVWAYSKEFTDPVSKMLTMLLEDIVEWENNKETII